MYGYPGQSHYGSYNSSFATAPTVYNALQPPQNTQTQPLGANPLGVGSANPTNVYASFSSGSTPSPYTGYAATPNAATAYAPFGQTAAAVAAVQQQQQAAASGVVNGPASGYGHSTRLADSFGSIPSTGATFTSLSDYTTALRPTAAVVSSGGNSYVGVTRIGSTASNPSALSVVSSSTASSAGYDVSLYAAATSNYLQSKATGTTNVWMSAKKPATALDYSGGTTFSSSGSNISGVVTGVVSNTASRGAPSARGTFPPKRYGGLTRAPRDLQQFYCEVCKISCAGSGTYKEHIDGQKHKRKEAMQKEGQVLSKSRVSYRCETCNVTCTGKDTYESHIRGSKHQKTAELMKKLGKPVQLQPTILPPGEKSNATPNSTNGVGNPIATVGGPAVPTKKVAGVSPVNFVGGRKHQSGTQDESKKSNDDTSVQKSAEIFNVEKDIEPVGEDYVEEERNAAGKLIQYNCKLCDCKFSDPNAKNIHVKGRKHRLQYKLKVNPSLHVEMKPNQIPREIRSELARKMRNHAMPLMLRPYGPPQPLMMFPPRGWYGLPDPGRRVETSEDRHVLAKHKMIYPKESQLAEIEKLIYIIEKALRFVSDHFAKEENNKEVKENEIIEQPKDRLLKGVMRVGLLAKNLLLKDDREVELVVLCSQVPTRTLLKQVSKLLADYVEKDEGEMVSVVAKPEESALFVKQSSLEVICRVVFTSPLLREGTSSLSNSAEEVSLDSKTSSSKDALPRGPCVDALAEIRHYKWFQIRCSSLQSAPITLRILRDIRQRVQTWQALSPWSIELLVEKVLASHGKPLSPGDALRRVFEAISSGILFACGPGLADPCEKDYPNVWSGLTGQQREDITSACQHALRLIAFNQIHRVLEMDRLTESHYSFDSLTGLGVPRPLNLVGPSGDRKRPRESNGSTEEKEEQPVVDVKKEKKEDEAKGDEKALFART